MILADPTFLSLRADAWAAIGAWLTLVVLVVSARFAYVQIRDARSLREEEARPVVVVDLDIDRQPHMIYVYFENTGRTSAHDVQLTFTPPLESTISGTKQAVEFLGHTFPTLPPGKRLESFFDSAIARLADGCTLPSRYEVVASYEDRKKHRYSDTYVLDIEAFRGRMYMGEKDIEDVAKALEQIGKTLAEWRSPYGGVRTIVQSEEAAEKERDDAMAEWQAKMGYPDAATKTASSGRPSEEEPPE